MEPQEPQKMTRAFVALELPLQVREEIADWGTVELADPALRAVSPGALHITLAFLGDLDEEGVHDAAAVLHGIVSRPVSVRLAPEPLALPERKPAKRLFVLEAESPAAREVQEDVVAGLTAAGLYEPEPERSFWAHVTVARVRRAKAEKRRQMAVQRPPGPLPKALREPFDAVRITLYRSKTQSAGPEYTPLAQVELPQGTHAGQR